MRAAACISKSVGRHETIELDLRTGALRPAHVIAAEKGGEGKSSGFALLGREIGAGGKIERRREDGKRPFIGRRLVSVCPQRRISLSEASGQKIDHAKVRVAGSQPGELMGGTI